MATVELYGKCKELGYCDCDGFLGCTSPSMVECTVCDRSHTPNHPHIANIDGDVPIDDEEKGHRPEAMIFLPPSQDQLPDWLRDKPGSQAIRPSIGTEATVDPTKLCQVCGEPWAPKHACKGAATSAGTFNSQPSKHVTPYHERKYQKCDLCGKVKRSNHNCKGSAAGEPGNEGIAAELPKPVVVTMYSAVPDKQCEYCEAAGELCVRHGGSWNGFDAPKRERVSHAVAGESAPRPASPPLDPELAAIGAILQAVNGLNQQQIKRAMGYVASRLEENSDVR